MQNQCDRTKELRFSRQRQAVFDAVAVLSNHPTADDVFAEARKRVPRISLGTVYRNLDLLAKQGAILQLDGGIEQRRYDRTTAPHCHIRCTRCGRVDDIPVNWQPDLDAVRHETEYSVDGVQINFTGLCPSCRRQ